MNVDARCRQLADSYLRHVLLALEDDDRGGNYRNFLDPWWSFTKGEPFVRVHSKAGWFSQHTLNDPCPKGCGGHRRRLEGLDWISKGAQSALDRRVCGCLAKKMRPDARDRDDRLIVEHSVPLIYLSDYLFDSKARWTLGSLRTFLDHHMKRALLTRAEDDRLNVVQEGRRLSSEMPADWKPWDDPYARYHARGIIRADAG